jgi:mono/diheme cytochrome c family protein
MFKQLKLKRYIAVIALGIVLTACGGSGSSGGSGASSQQSQAAGVSPAPLSYNGHTKAIIDSRCVTCHREGGQGPFSLDDYSKVAAKRSAMIFALESHSMPVPGFASISVPERELLLQWLEEGAAQGSPGEDISATPYTYYEHTKAIIDDNCANCHRPNDIAPFVLTDYDSVYSVRSAISHQIASGAMPPWPPTDHFIPLKNSRSLSDGDKAILNSWLSGGAPAGDPGDFVPVHKNETPIDYQLTVRLNEPYTPTERPDEYRCLVIDWPLDHTVFVDAVNLIPDAKAEVHHVFAVVIDPEKLAPVVEADGADGKPGFPCWGAPSPPGALVPPRTLTVWAPGISPGYLPEGTGIRIDPGSKILMQMHYNTINTEPVPDQSSLEIHYVEEVEREAVTLFFLDVGWYFPGGMPIPKGDPNVMHQYTNNFGFLLGFSGANEAGIFGDEPFAIHSAFLHQHVLGKSTSIELIREDGMELMLVDIRDWDFDWQDEYVFEEEIIMQPGDKLRLTCTWDNSAANQQFVKGKQLSPQYVEFGEGTVDEMCVNYFYVTKVKEEDKGVQQEFPPTVAFYRPEHLQVFSPGDYVPIELLVNAFKLQEPNSSHAEHGHSEEVTHQHGTGHYHIYLDSEDDSAEHLTRWDTSIFYQLPEAIAPGQHTLRVSLRDDVHQSLGIENRVTFIIEEAATDQQGSVEALIDVADWQQQGAALDSLASHRPDSVNCPSNAWYEEDGALEVETGYCNYLSLTQASKAPINKGDNIHLVLWHGQLRFDEPQEAHVAVSVGGKVVFDQQVEIPSDGGIYDVAIPSTVDVATGEPVEFHLHNHGYNPWTLLTLDVQH